ncbi:hypothetical protein EP10_001061 [Geobacillus icigianus]|uniref:Transposase n=1 Tax=Geobacillus icigianus TaxID=1430331 RepID=A0ABU6BE48_9BACL|nr:hypothetical protein [Geobacillus icigianus]
MRGMKPTAVLVRKIKWILQGFSILAKGQVYADFLLKSLIFLEGW